MGKDVFALNAGKLKAMSNPGVKSSPVKISGGKEGRREGRKTKEGRGKERRLRKGEGGYRREGWMEGR